MRIRLPFKKHGLNAMICFLFMLPSLAVAQTAASDESESQALQADQAIFWSIEKDGNKAGYLLGTIHSEDPRVLDFSEEFLQKLKSNTMFAMEMVPDLTTLARLTEYMHYPPGQTLEAVIGQKRYDALIVALSVYGVPAEFVSRMKPWAAMMTLSTPPPVTGFFMDLSLSLRASGNGLKVVGLETLEQQLSFLEDMPMSMQLHLLDQAIAEAGHVKEEHDQMVAAYLQNNLQQLLTLSEEELQTVGPEVRDYFFESGIVKRNHRMLESLLSHLGTQTVFIAVGALHLTGDEGLLRLLRKNGFELAPLEMPFIPE